MKKHKNRLDWGLENYILDFEEDIDDFLYRKRKNKVKNVCKIKKSNIRRS